MKYHMYRSGIRDVLLGAVLLVLSACSGGGGGDGGTAAPPPTSSGGGWVNLTAPGGTSSVEICNSASLSGNAFISSTFYRCCSGSATDTGVKVTWQNLSTGESGDAYQHISLCLFVFTPVLCDHTWRADIPLRIGSNTIRIRAAEELPGTAWGTVDTVINHPETSYKIMGHLLTTDGRPLWWYESGIAMKRGGGTTALSNQDGSYSFLCVRNGIHTVTPTSPLGQTYTPTTASVTVNGADVSGVDFTTDVHFVSGSVTWASSGTPSDFEQVILENGTESISTFSDSLGMYRLAVPNGSYRVYIKPYGAITFSPAEHQVTNSGFDVGGVNFAKQ